MFADILAFLIFAAVAVPTLDYIFLDQTDFIGCYRRWWIDRPKRLWKKIRG